MKKFTEIAAVGLLSLVWLLPMSAEAQLLKKLGKRAEKAAERTILNRTDKEVSKATDKAIDGVLEGGDKEGKQNDKATEQEKGSAKLPAFLGGGIDDIPDTYTFSYRMTMKITNAKDELAMRYWLEPKAPYFGSEMLNDQANQITVMDLENPGMVMFMDNGQQKMAMRIKGNQQLIDKYVKQAAAEAEENTDNVKLTPIGTKTILGYTCKGYQMETDDGIAKVWITDQAPVGSIAGVLQTDQLPGGTLGFGSDALLMEMEFIPHKKKKDQLHMICTELKESPLTIRKAEYQSLGGR